MYLHFNHGPSNVQIPDDNHIADFIISEIRNRIHISNMYDYATNLLAEHNYANELVDDVIARPKMLLQYIADNPTEVPVQQRFETALSNYADICAYHTVAHDRAFVSEMQRTERPLLLAIGQEDSEINNLLADTGYLEANTNNAGPQKIGNYTPRTASAPKTIGTVRTGRQTKIQPRAEKPASKYEPSIKPVANKRPLLRNKEYYVQDGKMAYADHSTFNRLSITESDVKPKPNFFAGVENPDNILDDAGFTYAKVEDLYVTCHSQATALAWAKTLAVKGDLRMTDTIVDITYQTVQIADVAPDKSTRELALLNIGAGAKILEGNIATFAGLVDTMEQLREVASTSPTAELLLRTVNRRATIAVNKLLRYDLAVEKQYITDFISDWFELRSYLISEFSEKSVVAELGKYERSTVMRILNIYAPTNDEADELVETTYSNELLQRSIVTKDNHFTTVLPISAGQLNFALDDRTSYISHIETPEVYNYILAIIRRAEEHAPLHSYESISITTIDRVRFNVMLTDVSKQAPRVSSKPYLAITFVDYQ